MPTRGRVAAQELKLNLLKSRLSLLVLLHHLHYLSPPHPSLVRTPDFATCKLFLSTERHVLVPPHKPLFHLLLSINCCLTTLNPLFLSKLWYIFLNQGIIKCLSNVVFGRGFLFKNKKKTTSFFFVVQVGSPSFIDIYIYIFFKEQNAQRFCRQFLKFQNFVKPWPANIFSFYKIDCSEQIFLA